MTALAVAALVFIAGPAHADSVNELMAFGAVNSANDASGEYISNGGTTKNDYDGTRVLSVGDAVRGAFNLSRLNDSTTNIGTPVDISPANGIGFTSHEWTGAFSIKVVSLTEVDPTPDGNPFESDWTIVFGADPNFGAWLNAIQAGKGSGMVAGTAVRLWEDTTPDFDLLSKAGDADVDDADAHVATAMDGSWYWDLGFGTRGSAWVATNSALAAPAGITSALATSPANFELTLLARGLGVMVAEGGLIGAITGGAVDFAGNTSIFGAGTEGSTIPNEETAGFHARDKATLNFIAVPTPSAVWAGLALMGLLGINRLRRRKES